MLHLPSTQLQRGDWRGLSGGFAVALQLIAAVAHRKCGKVRLLGGVSASRVAALSLADDYHLV